MSNKTLHFLFLISALLPGVEVASKSTGELQFNESEYFEARGVNVLVFSNWYDGLFSDSKISGIELIHHGVRTATNGDVRLHATPEQWDAIPEFVEREVDTGKKTVTAHLRYPQYDFDYRIRVRAENDSVLLEVMLPKALPRELVGKAGLNLEFLPSAYFEQAFIADEHSGTFPLYPTGPKEQNDELAPTPLASARHLTLAPGNPERRVSIESLNGTLNLYDGRNKAQNGWFVVRGLLPAKRKGTVLKWRLHAHGIKNWLREPVIAHSQVGYHPRQTKQAVIELDGNAPASGEVSLYRINKQGESSLAKQGAAEFWGQYKRYNYLQFDFSGVRKEGVYQLEYQGVRTAPFRIAEDIYAKIWHPTLDIFFPVQMDHVLVNEAYRVWHGASHLDDALQAPVDHQHFDLYAQGPTTDTPYQPGEHIPGLNIGGWYDAGDYDIRTQTQYRTVLSLVEAWETFKPQRDNTLVDYPAKYVDIHVPDGKPDILQQIEHGTLGLLAQFRAVGHAIPGIIVPEIAQYTHLGDGLTMTDNLVYNPALDELESNGRESGKFDDRWAFTSETSALNYGATAALAAASRALEKHNPELARECLQTALATWEKEQNREPLLFRHGNTTGGPLELEKLKATVELLISTGEERFAQSVHAQFSVIEEDFANRANLAVRALPWLGSEHKQKLRELAQQHRGTLAEYQQQNPFGVHITEGGWAGNGTIIHQANVNYYLHHAFPDIIGREAVFRGLHYIFGTHPHSSVSFVSGVGTRSKRVAYGMNRADFSFIAGGIVPGVLILNPDFPENKEDWPFLWGENEYVVNVGGSYLFLALAAQSLLSGK